MCMDEDMMLLEVRAVNESSYFTVSHVAPPSALLNLECLNDKNA